MKTQVVIEAQSQKICATAFASGREHDFALCAQTMPELCSRTLCLADSGYQGIATIHEVVQIPRKDSKHNPLSDEDICYNRDLARRRVPIEHVFARLKVFKILAHPYRNRRQRFEIRFNLIAAIHNLEL